MNRLLLFLLLIPSTIFAQWSLTSGVLSGRNDDIQFLNDSIAYVAGGSQRYVYKSTNGGNSWFIIYSGSKYLRSVKFVDESLGFAGTLDSSFIMTTNGGSSWSDISRTISPRTPGVCGLSVPDDSTIYGVGIFNQPAFFVKSLDRGQSWNSVDMSSQVSALVDVNFISRDTGWVCGRANPQTDGGEILYTTDGGLNWVSVYKTQRNLDYVWKIQSPDGQNYFASVSSTPSANGTYFLKSSDRGLTWTEGLVDSTFTDIQMIGFIDSLHGFTGGATDIFETFDGGASWVNANNTVPAGAYYNRFVKVNDSVSFISGSRIYKYLDSSNVTGITDFVPKSEIHELNVFPNPTSDLKFKVSIGNKTHAVIQLINLSGELIEEFYDGVLQVGTHSFNSKKNLSNQMVFVIMRTNEGLQYKKVVLQ